MEYCKMLKIKYINPIKNSKLIYSKIKPVFTDILNQEVL